MLVRPLIAAGILAFCSQAHAARTSCDYVAESSLQPVGAADFNPQSIAFDVRCTDATADVCVYHDRDAIRILGAADGKSTDQFSLYQHAKYHVGRDGSWGFAQYTYLASEGPIATILSRFFGSASPVESRESDYLGYNAQYYSLSADQKSLKLPDGRSVPCSPVEAGYIPATHARLVERTHSASGAKLLKGDVVTDGKGRFVLANAILMMDGRQYVVGGQTPKDLFIFPVRAIKQDMVSPEVSARTWRYLEIGTQGVEPVERESLWRSGRPANWSDLETSVPYLCTAITGDDVLAPLSRFAILRGEIKGYGDYGYLDFRVTTRGLEAERAESAARRNRDSGGKVSMLIRRASQTGAPLLVETRREKPGQAAVRARYACWPDREHPEWGSAMFDRR
jgi:hypothetical protein